MILLKELRKEKGLTQLPLGDTPIMLRYKTI